MRTYTFIDVGSLVKTWATIKARVRVTHWDHRYKESTRIRVHVPEMRMRKTHTVAVFSRTTVVRQPWVAILLSYGPTAMTQQWYGIVRLLCSNRTMIVVVVQSFTIVVRYSLISTAVVLTSYDSRTGNNLAVAIGWKPGYKVCDQTMHEPYDLSLWLLRSVT